MSCKKRQDTVTYRTSAFCRYQYAPTTERGGTVPQRTPMTLTEWQNEVRTRTESMLAGRRAQPLALLNRKVNNNPEPWQALCMRVIPFAAACLLQIRRGYGEISDTTHRQLAKMIRYIDNRAAAGDWRGEALAQYRELRRLIAEIDPEALPERDEMDRQYRMYQLDPATAIT